MKKLYSLLASAGLLLATSASAAGIEFLEYIASTSTGTQKIDTGIAGAATYGLETGIAVTGVCGSWQSLIAGTQDNFTLGTQNSNRGGCYLSIRGGSVYNNAANIISDSACTDIVIKDGSFTVGGVVKGSGFSGAFDSSAANIFFCNNANPGKRPSPIRIYYARLYDENGDLLADFYPVRLGDGTLGLYDSARKTFVANAGTGVFTAGPVSEPEELPDGFRKTGDTLEVRISVTAADNAEYTVNGTAYTGSQDIWVAAGPTCKIVATDLEPGERVPWAALPRGARATRNSLTWEPEFPANVALSATEGFDETTWIGGTGAQTFTAPANWSNGVPDLNKKAIIAPTAALTLTLADGTLIGALVAGGGGGAVNFTVNGAVQIVGDFDYKSGTMTFSTNKRMDIGGDFTVRSGVKVDHTICGQGNSGATIVWSEYAYRVDISAQGDVTVEAGGAIDATNCHEWRNGLSYGKSGNRAGHGGCMASGAFNSYGSITSPTNCGTGSWNAKGGGAVKVFSGGTMTVNGSIKAEGGKVTSGHYSGAGGSVWIGCKALVGSGAISAIGGQCADSEPGGGGRIAIWYSGDDPAANWTGTVNASGGQTLNPNSREHGPAGTIYYQFKDGLVENSLVVVTNICPSKYRSSYGCTDLGSYVDGAKLGTVVISPYCVARVREGDQVTVYGDWTCGGTLSDASDNTVEFAGTKTSTISGKTTFRRFICNAPGKTLKFDTTPASVMSVATRFEVNGTAEQPVTLAPTTDATWKFSVASDAAQKVNRVSVTSSVATVAADIIAYDSTGTEDCVGWDFSKHTIIIVPGEEIVWTGAAGSQWLNAANWDRTREPVSTDHIIVTGEDAESQPVPNLPILDNTVLDQTVSILEFRNHADCTINGASFTVTNLFKVGGSDVTLKGSVPLAAKKAEIAAGGVFVVDGNAFSAEDEIVVADGGLLVVTNGATLTAPKLTVNAGGRVAFDTGSVTIGSRLEVADGATLAVRTAALRLEGDVLFGADDVYAAGIGKVTLGGTADQTLDCAGATFADILVDKPEGDLAFASALNATKFQCAVTSSRAIAFAAGETFAFDDLTLNGLVGGKAVLTLCSDEPGTAWLLKLTAVHDIAGVLVSDSDARAGETVYTCAPSAAVGENVQGWDFNATILRWVGGSGTDFATAANWSPAQAPDPASRVVISPTAAATVDIPADTRVAALTAGGLGGALTLNVNGALTVDGSIDLRAAATMVFKTAEAASVGSLAVRDGALVKHAELQNAALDAYRVAFDVEGTVLVEEGGAIDATACVQDHTSFGLVGSRACHGGCFTNWYPSICYGSLSEPTTCGAGYSVRGGGVVRLVAGGDVQVNGRIAANGAPRLGEHYSGSGGSVWLTCPSLSGRGLVSANGGLSGLKEAGAGGRVAVHFTGEAPLANWTGDICAYGGLSASNESPGPAGTVYIQKAGETVRQAAVRIATDCVVGGGAYRQPTRWVTELGASTGSACVGPVTLEHGAKIILTSDVSVEDLDLGAVAFDPLPTSDVPYVLFLNGHRLFIRNRRHVNGRGWYANWRNYVNTDNGGEIIWMSPLSIRLR